MGKIESSMEERKKGRGKVGEEGEEKDEEDEKEEEEDLLMYPVHFLMIYV